MPLMIGGATTSRVHTAVKIAPNYDGPVIYVPDASRSVGVATSLMSDQAPAYLAELAQEYEDVRRCHANRKAVPLVSLAEARAARPQIDWSGYQPPRPKFLGRRAFKSYDLAEIARYIDWGRSSRRGACSARSPPSWTTRWWASRRARSTRKARPCSSASSTGAG